MKCTQLTDCGCERCNNAEDGWDTWVNHRSTNDMEWFYEQQLLTSLRNLKLANGEPPDSALRVRTRAELDAILNRVIVPIK